MQNYTVGSLSWGVCQYGQICCIHEEPSVNACLKIQLKCTVSILASILPQQTLHVL